MSKILPIDEIDAHLTLPENAPCDMPFPEGDARLFSVSMASRLMDLCECAERFSSAIYVQRQADDLFAAFRSTADPAHLLNIRGDTPVNAVPFTTGLVYGPLVESFKKDVADSLSALKASKRLLLAGHGIGAAYALLAAVELNAQGQPVAAVYTFGSPRIGDRTFIRHLPCPVFRVVNNLDVMVTMPTPWDFRHGNWRHAGQYKLINAGGTINEHPNLWNRLPGFLRQTAWLNKLLLLGIQVGFPCALFKLLQQVLGDHAQAAYISRLHALRDSELERFTTSP